MSAEPNSPALNQALPRYYEVTVLDSYNLVHPTEKLHQYPGQLEEGDRTGLYLRVASKSGTPWIGFFALGFQSEQGASGVFSCPDPDWFCAVAGGYAYVVNASKPDCWIQIE